MKNLIRFGRRQNGQALILAMIMLAIGGLIIGPLVGLVTTSLNVGRNVEIQVEDYYAADAGVEHALWEIRQDPQDSSRVPVMVTDFREFNLLTPTNGETVHVKVTKQASNLYKVESSSTGTDSNTLITAFIISTNLNIFDGAMVASNDITLKKDAYINGDVFALGEFDAQGGLIHEDDNDGTPEIIENAAGLVFPTAQENAAFALGFKTEALVGGTITGNYKINDPPGASITVDFGPKYITGNLTTDKNIIINLHGTIYVEGTIDIGQDTLIQGTGSIVAVGNIGFEKIGNYGTNPTGNDLIFSVNGSIDFRKEADLEALIYAPNGGISFKKEAEIIGSVICGQGIDIPEDISADKNFSIIYNPEYKDTMNLPGFNPTAVRTWNITAAP
ncbi:pilus assembly PilX N-terminal domain-containing protein [Dehalogenimonas sp. 4OHTPN]|uniref:Pilus assembly PilX N-terminal domain-containing protein n=1 Tax=Dehalogenimonas sp. 4OHTPN TaxID=3166643 RepID=A0AAU8G8A6_9CHLR